VGPITTFIYLFSIKLVGEKILTQGTTLVVSKYCNKALVFNIDCCPREKQNTNYIHVAKLLS
jgi:hypothetical protein